MNIGARIKQLRCKVGLTQDQLAERLGISGQAVSKWETAITMPDISLLPMLAEEFGVSIDELFDLTVEQKMNRIEKCMDCEGELSFTLFSEYEEFLKTILMIKRIIKDAPVCLRIYIITAWKQMQSVLADMPERPSPWHPKRRIVNGF